MATMDAARSKDQRAQSPAALDLLGRVLSVSGSQASIGLPAAPLNASDDPPVTVGKFLGVRRGKTLLIGMITDISIETLPAARKQGYHATARLDLMGEIKEDETGSAQFQRGVTDYPAIGDPPA